MLKKVDSIGFLKSKTTGADIMGVAGILRSNKSKREFGNKATWDTPFEVHFRKFVKEANDAVFFNGKKNQALNLDVFELPEEFDLVYIDTPSLLSQR